MNGCGIDSGEAKSVVPGCGLCTDIGEYGTAFAGMPFFVLIVYNPKASCSEYVKKDCYFLPALCYNGTIVIDYCSFDAPLADETF